MPAPRTARRPRRPPLADMPLDSPRANGAAADIEDDDPPAGLGAAAPDDLQPELPQSVEFFDHVRSLTTAQWEHHDCYLNRLEPPVKNAGTYNYLRKYNAAFDQDDVKREFGGGKYQVILIDRSQSVGVTGAKREIKFSCSGKAILEEGQMLRKADGSLIPVVPADQVPAAGSAGTAAAGDASAINAMAQAFQNTLREVVNLAKGNNGQAPDVAAIAEGMRKANEIALGMVKEQAATQVSREDKSHDRLVELLMSERKQQSTQATDPLSEFERMIKMFSLVKSLNPDIPHVPARDPLDTLVKLKEVIGDRVFDLFGEGGAESTAMALVKELAPTAIPGLLELGNRYLTIQQQRIHLDRAAIEMRSGKTIDMPPVQPIPTPATPAPAQPGAATPAQEPNPMAGISPQDQIAHDIAIIYLSQGDGRDAARAVMLAYPQVVPMLKPFLGDLAKVMEFARGHRELSQICGEPDFPQFAGEFCSEILNPTPDDDEGEEPGPAKPPPSNPAPPRAN